MERYSASAIDMTTTSYISETFFKVISPLVEHFSIIWILCRSDLTTYSDLTWAEPFTGRTYLIVGASLFVCFFNFLRLWTYPLLDFILFMDKNDLQLKNQLRDRERALILKEKDIEARVQREEEEQNKEQKKVKRGTNVIDQPVEFCKGC
ncbi:hypothetical protein EUTSA_v10023042mg, partial [Eutrema salsugineum]